VSVGGVINPGLSTVIADVKNVTRIKACVGFCAKTEKNISTTTMTTATVKSWDESYADLLAYHKKHGLSKCSAPW
jgi:hypothetical protein